MPRFLLKKSEKIDGTVSYHQRFLMGEYDCKSLECIND